MRHIKIVWINNFCMFLTFTGRYFGRFLFILTNLMNHAILAADLIYYYNFNLYVYEFKTNFTSCFSGQHAG